MAMLQETADTVHARAFGLLRAGQIDTALAALAAARLAHPDHAPIALAHADALHAARRLPEACAAYDAALRLQPDSADGWYGAGCAQLARKSFAAALACLERAAAIAPHSGEVCFNHAQALFELGRVEQAVAGFQQVIRLAPALAPMAQANIACLIPGSDEADNAAVLRARRDWARGSAAALAKPPPQPIPRSSGKLRIGYVSSFFGARNWMKPVFALINRHDRAAFEIYLINDGTLPDAASGYADHDADYVYDLRGVPNDQAAGIIASIGLDVLVDLNGYSVQGRLPMLMPKPARHLVGWFNMFATTGIPAYDFIVGDATVIPPAEEKYYSERVHRVSGSYLAFEILYKVPEITQPPCLQAGFITFGCLGSQYKLTDGVLAAWADILRGVPGARLFLKNGALEDIENRHHLRARLAALGIAADRITMHGRSEHFDFLDAYRHVDIALDTFPYNGGTTTTEALYQGVPVLTFDGDRWASRTSKSLLLAAGLPDWVRADRADYIARAISLGTDARTPAMLAELRSGLRGMLENSSACDADRLCAEMEAFYRGLG